MTTATLEKPQVQVRPTAVNPDDRPTLATDADAAVAWLVQYAATCQTQAVAPAGGRRW